MVTLEQKIEEACSGVNKAWQAADSSFEKKPQIVIITGSGLGSIAKQLSPGFFEMDYDDIPYLHPSGMPGHVGRVLIGHYGGDNCNKVIVLDGRIHGYEGHSPQTQVMPLLMAHRLCDNSSSPLVVVTNASGAINEQFSEGQIMLITDHINGTGRSVVELREETRFGGDNLDMTFAYTPALQDVAKQVALANNIDLAEGIYLGTVGAMFETPAEIRAFRAWGADAVGMSTVHEVTCASRLGMQVLGLSVLCNMAAGIEKKALTLKEVLEGSSKASKNLEILISGILESLS